MVSEEYFEVRVDERAVGGRANKRLLEILAEHFDNPKSKICILKGTKNKKQNNPNNQLIIVWIAVILPLAACALLTRSS